MPWPPRFPGATAATPGPLTGAARAVCTPRVTLPRLTGAAGAHGGIGAGATPRATRLAAAICAAACAATQGYQPAEYTIFPRIARGLGCATPRT